MARKARKARRRKPPGSKRFDWGLARRVVVPAGLALSVVGLGAGMTFGVDRLDREARLVLAAKPIEIELNHPRTGDGVEWIPPDQHAALVRQARAALERVDPFDVRALRRVSETLDATGWFREAPRVVRTSGHSVRIEAPWRIPAGVVRSGNRDQLISWDGMPMPMEYLAGASGAVTILGAGLAPADPQTMFAHPWPGTDVQAALHLLRMLQKEEEFFGQVAAIDVSGLARNGPIVIITRDETRVVWGGEPGAYRPGEVPDEVKLERLRQINRRYGRIDAGGELVEIHSHLPQRRPTDAAP